MALLSDSVMKKLVDHDIKIPHFWYGGFWAFYGLQFPLAEDSTGQIPKKRPEWQDKFAGK